MHPHIMQALISEHLRELSADVRADVRAARRADKRRAR
jgi:hypothetical protein